MSVKSSIFTIQISFTFLLFLCLFSTYHVFIRAIHDNKEDPSLMLYDSCQPPLQPPLPSSSYPIYPPPTSSSDPINPPAPPSSSDPTYPPPPPSASSYSAYPPPSSSSDPTYPPPPPSSYPANPPAPPSAPSPPPSLSPYQPYPTTPPPPSSSYPVNPPAPPSAPSPPPLLSPCHCQPYPTTPPPPSPFPPPPPSPPPSPPPPPPPPPPISRVKKAAQVIEHFLKGIRDDKCGLTNLRTQTSPNICKNPKFGCARAPLDQQEALYAIQFNECFIKGNNPSHTITLNNFIENLSDISIFHANSNNFAGIIPNLSNLPYLYELDLSNNKYTGNFPLTLLEASNLSYLDLRFNSFTGTLPPQVFNLPLLALFLNNNKFNNQLPSNLGSTPAAYLTLANNKFTGSIPRSIDQASNTLLEILFLNNKLSGCLPYEIGFLNKTRVFDVSINRITGPIPHSFACLEKMEYLDLGHNRLYGSVPEEICKLPKLKRVNLCGNYFTQLGPICRKLMRKGVLNMRDNCVLGLPDQKMAGKCKRFFKKGKSLSCGDDNGMKFKYIPCNNSATYLNRTDIGEAEGVLEIDQIPVTYAVLTPTIN